MAIIHIAAMSAALKKKLARTCPQCGASQPVLKEYVNETVVCSDRGAMIPPKAESKDASR